MNLAERPGDGPRFPLHGLFIHLYLLRILHRYVHG